MPVAPPPAGATATAGAMSGALELHDLSEPMREALVTVMPARPGNIHEHERNPEGWTRGTPKRTVEALRRRGLVDDYWPDPIGGFRAHLTETGVTIRSELVALEAGLVPPEIARHYRR